VQAVILEANGMSDIDFTGLQALRDLVPHQARFAMLRVSGSNPSTSSWISE
jgi:hypothetical protein